MQNDEMDGGAPAPARIPYRLDDQVGFILRQAMQRHSAIFSAQIGTELTTTQWAALAKLHEAGPLSQNLLGRRIAMDAATVKGVVDRLVRRGLATATPSQGDARRLLVALTPLGADTVKALHGNAAQITEETLRPLSPEEREQFLALLLRLR